MSVINFPTRRIAIIVLGASLLPFASANAYQAKSTAPLNLNNQGTALRGYDPVAYFVDGKATIGKADITATHSGAIYRFASAANRDRFVASPSKFEPVFGGYCAYAASRGYKADADPNAWHVIDGRLFVNYNAAVAKNWATRAAAYIKAGDENWPRVQLLPAQ